MSDDRPNPSPPAVRKIRLRYAKRGKLRFASHRDLTRAFERAVRKAGLPVAHSQGYSPHPRISWIGAAPTGSASEAEYVEIGFVEPLEPETVLDRLAPALPPDMPALEAVVAGEDSLADRMEASHWRIEITGLAAEELRTAAAALMAADEVLVPRRTKRGVRDIDVRAGCVSVVVSDVSSTASSQVRAVATELSPAAGPAHGPGYGILDAVVRQMTPTVRPDDVLRALQVVGGREWPESLTKATRVAQGPLDEAGCLVDPLAVDRDRTASAHR